MQLMPFWGCMIPLKYPQMESAVRFTMEKLGVELIDDNQLSCCPDPIYFKAGNKMKWLTLAARNISIAEEKGLDLITMCSGCTATLCEVNHHLKEDDSLKKEVNKNLKEIGREYKGTVKVRHLVTVLRDDIGLKKIRNSVKVPMEDIKVAIHYGCHLLKPSAIMNVEDPLTPTILAELIKATGAVPVDHKEYLMCCGKACKDVDLSLNMSNTVFESIEESEADCLGLICPTCFDSFDIGQIRISRHFDKDLQIPVIYYFQLLALAQGATIEKVGIPYHKIMPQSFIEKLQPVAELID
jgi:heterodisulfide reductase subunit B